MVRASTRAEAPSRRVAWVLSALLLALAVLACEPFRSARQRPAAPAPAEPADLRAESALATAEAQSPTPDPRAETAAPRAPSAASDSDDTTAWNVPLGTSPR